MNRLPVLLSRYDAVCYAVLRMVLGLLFACHGAQKLFGAFDGKVTHSPLGFSAGLIELITGLLIAVGLFTRLAAFLASGEMAVAYFIVCASRSFWPIVNGGEMAVLYCFAFLFIFFHGADVWSVDSRFRRADG